MCPPKLFLGTKALVCLVIIMAKNLAIIIQGFRRTAAISSLSPNITYLSLIQNFMHFFFLFDIFDIEICFFFAGNDTVYTNKCELNKCLPSF